MTIALADTYRNSMLQVISDAIDADAAAGTLKIYSGTQPAKGGTETTILAEIPFAYPSASTITGGVLTFNTTGMSDSSANATGTATWARAMDNTGDFVMDMTVSNTGGGGDVQLNSTAIQAGTTVTVTAASITAGNA